MKWCIWYKYIYYTRTKSTNYTCPSGYTRDGSKCHKSTTSTIDATEKITYTCPQGGTLNGTKCTITKDATAHPGQDTYSCRRTASQL